MLSIISAGAAAPIRPRAPAAAQAVRGEAVDAFSALHAEAARPLWRYLYRTGGDRAVADDLVQESFLRLLERPALLADPQAARPYLFRIASNLLRDRWRRQARHDRLRPPATVPAIPSHGAASRTRRDVEAVLGALSRRERALVWLAHVEGFRHAEIARILGLARPSVKVLLHRAKTKLLGLLEARGYAPGRTR